MKKNTQKIKSHEDEHNRVEIDHERKLILFTLKDKKCVDPETFLRLSLMKIADMEICVGQQVLVKMRDGSEEYYDLAMQVS